MDLVSQLLQTRDPAQLRRHGLALDDRGRLVSVHEARAVASRSIEADVDWQWPYRSSLERELSAMVPPARVARGTEPPPIASNDTGGEWGSLLDHLARK